MSIYLFTEKNDCYGCGACENVCPVGAISMLPDGEGFLYPQIDDVKCVECKKCINACQIHSFKAQNIIEPLVYAAKNKDENIRANSTSGGAFSALATETLKRGGAVYGVAYDDKFTAVHERALDYEGCKRFLGSKYVQSKIGDAFSQIKQDLTEGKAVLFTGTPCQVAGLSTYLGDMSSDSNLLLCEIICHGVPSPLMWKEHVMFLEKTRKSKLVMYKHRSKVDGWHGHNEHSFFANGKNEWKTKLSQNHKDLFYAHLIIRPSCYTCPYAGTHHTADLSIADYWGIEHCMKDFDDNKGVSLIVVNTQRGKAYFEAAAENLECRESNLTDAFRDNHKKPAKRNINRSRFWEDYHKHGYAYVLKKYSSYTVTGKIKRQIKFKSKIFIQKIGLYNLIHQFTKRKYQKDTYK